MWLIKKKFFSNCMQIFVLIICLQKVALSVILWQKVATYDVRVALISFEVEPRRAAHVMTPLLFLETISNVQTLSWFP